MLRPQIHTKRETAPAAPASTRATRNQPESARENSAHGNHSNSTTVRLSLKRLLSSPRQIWLIILGSLVAEVAIASSILTLFEDSESKTNLLKFIGQPRTASLLNEAFLWTLLILLIGTALLACSSPRWKSLAFRGFIDLQRSLLEYPKITIFLPTLIIILAALEIILKSSQIGLGMVIVALLISGLTFHKIFHEYKDLLSNRLNTISNRKLLVGSFLRFRWRLHLTGLICARLVSIIGLLLFGAGGFRRSDFEIHLRVLTAQEEIQRPYITLLCIVACWGISGVLIGLLRPPRRISDFLGEGFCNRCSRFLFLPVAEGEKYCPSCKVGVSPRPRRVAEERVLSRTAQKRAKQLKRERQDHLRELKASRRSMVKASSKSSS